MANNITAVTPKLLAGTVPVLRENAVMPRLVNNDISTEAAMKGATVDVPIPSEFVVEDVVPTHNFVNPPQDMTPKTVPVPLNRWKRVPFHLTDKDMLEIDDGVLPREIEAAVKAIANEVDSYLLGLYVEFYGYHGTPGTPPFADEKHVDAAQIRRVLNNQLCPLEPRHVVFDADAEANALAVPAFANAEWHGDPQAIIDGKLNRRLGFTWWMNQNVQSHETGDAAGYLVNGAHTTGDTVITINTGADDFNVGDLISFADHTQSYVVTANGAPTTVTIRPPLVQDVPTTTAITSVASHVANLAFHPNAFAYATRPLAQVDARLGVITEVVVDPISGVAMRMQIRYGDSMTIWSFDVLYGGEVVRPELGARLLG